MWADARCPQEGSWQLLIRSRYLELTCGTSQGPECSLKPVKGGLCMKLRLSAGMHGIMTSRKLLPVILGCEAQTRPSGRCISYHAC